MRIKLSRGKQRELINTTKLKNNYSWTNMARILEISRTTLKDWYDEKNLISKNAFLLLDKEEKYTKFIKEYKKENWGRSKGGILSKGNTKTIRYPKKTKKLAEFIGIVLGDGNIHVFKRNKSVRNYVVRIAGDSRHDFDYLTKYVKCLCEDLFSINAKIHKGKNSNVIYVSLYGIKLIEFLLQMDLKPGNKIKNQTTIPKWVWKKDSYLKACIRGLYDTDGSVYELIPHWPGLFQIYFSNRNLTLLKDVRKALMKLKIKVSKISNLKEGSTPRIYITRKDQIRKFYKTIGFKNQRHIKKLRCSPVV